jgi:tetratricopeptide (TPR) repeat protein
MDLPRDDRPRPTPQLSPADIPALIEAGRVDEAAGLAEAAIAAGARHPLLFTLTAHVLERAGRWDEAVERLGQGLAHAPEDAGLLTLLGTCVARLGRADAAKAAFEAALARAPDNPAACFGLGALYAAEAQYDLAAPLFRRAVEMAPGWAAALDLGAETAARRGDWELARAWVRRVAAAENPTAALTLARVEAHDADAPSAERRLTELLDRPGIAPELRADALSVLGDLLNGEGRAPEAFEAYAARNVILRELRGPVWRAPSAGLSARIDRLSAWLDGLAPPARARRQARRTRSPAAGHVFLLSFPRSGTTLLEQVLACHPDVVALEEAPTMLDAEEDFFLKGDGLQRLAALDAAGEQGFRDAYWRRVRDGGVEPDGKTFVDKMPINTMVLPLIARLFPEAKVLFALRDPRDVVLSCFRRAFVANAVTFHLLDIEDAARFYGKVMGFAGLCRARLPLQLYDVRYERLVADLPGETQRLCAFLGLGWTPALLDFAETARRRVIKTPSATQVRGRLFSGEGQWRAYRREMAGALAILEPWVERFGYDPH